MRKVYTLQLSDFFPSATLPQAMGSLLGYVFQNSTIEKNFKVIRTFWENETFDQVVSEIDKPDVLLCSCYVWNWDRTYQVIQFVRNNYPSCLIVIGGPEPKYSSEWLKDHPEIDVLVPYYGEEVLENVLLESLDSKKYEHVPGVITKNFTSTNFPRPNFSKTESPFLNGFFDHLIKNKRKATREVRAVFESNRGCPFTCTFCDVGASQYNRIYAFDLQRCFDELEWMAKNQIDAIDVADANFGILPRDEIIVNKMVDFKEKYQWKGRFLPTWSKVKGERVLKIAKIIIENGMDSIFGLSLQTLSKDVLKNIKRKNAFTLDDLSEIVKDLNQNDVHVYTEVIFPLPGESLQSFKEGIHSVLDMEHVFDKFQVNQLSHYNNAAIANEEQTKEFEINWARVNGFTRHYYGSNSKDTIAIATKDISQEEVFEGLFYVKSFIIPLYFYGTVRSFVDEVNRLEDLKRSHFFQRLYTALKTEPWFKEFKESQRQHYLSAVEGKSQFGQLLTDDPMNFFPEFSIAHQFYLRSPIYEKLEEIYPEHKQLIHFSKNSVWLNKAEEMVLEISKSNQKESWLLADDREMSTEEYYRELYISGRFDRRWKKQSIVRI